MSNNAKTIDQLLSELNEAVKPLLGAKYKHPGHALSEAEKLVTPLLQPYGAQFTNNVRIALFHKETTWRETVAVGVRLDSTLDKRHRIVPPIRLNGMYFEACVQYPEGTTVETYFDMIRADEYEQRCAKLADRLEEKQKELEQLRANYVSLCRDKADAEERVRKGKAAPVH